ncbi:hypothetical protein [Georgenia muralis]|uniref:hypothetical protein n=1 Tax=Georgenia muralis TaxID=154117 RepID=UPI000F4F7C68|nr:hypothetical protein [Georgenia muralis]
MRFEWVTLDDGRSGLEVARLDTGDATPPVTSLYLDHEPRTRPRDYLAVASALAFGQYIGEVFGPPSGMSERVSAAIQQFLRPRSIRPIHVRGGSDDPVFGERSLRAVSVVDPLRDTVRTDERRDVFAIHLLRMDLFTGSVLSRDALWVATNTDLVGAGSPLSALHAETAVAMLLAADLGAGSVQLSCRVGTSELTRLSALVGAVGLGVVVTG